MKNILSLLGICLLQSAAAQTGIGTTAPNPASVLDVNSTTKGMLVPRLTDGALGALAGREGMLAYSLDKHNFVGYISGEPSTALSVPLSPTSPGQLNIFLYAGQTFKLPASTTTAVPLQELGVNIVPGASGYTMTINIFAGSGIGGTLLGSSSLEIPAGSSAGMYYVNLANNNILLQPGQMYTFTVNQPLTAAGIRFSGGNPYADGAMFSNAASYPTQDLVFTIRGQGAAKWLQLAAASDTIYTSPLYSGGTTFVSAYQIRATRVGKSITLTFPSDVYNLNVSGSEITANIPVGYRPAYASLLPIRVVSGNNITIGLAFLDPANGRVNLRANAGGSNWGGANSGFSSFSITYPAP